MSTICNSAATLSTAGNGIFGKLAAAAGRGFRAFIAWRARQAAISHLHSMSDRELKDIGLSRPEIEFAVMGERARERALRYY